MQKRRATIVKNMTGGIAALLEGRRRRGDRRQGPAARRAAGRGYAARRRPADPRGEERGTRERFGADRAAVPEVRPRDDPRFLGRAGIRGGAEAPVRDRRRRHRPGARQRVAPARRRGHGARGAAGLPADGRPPARGRGSAALQEAGTRYPARRQGERRRRRQGRRHGQVRRCEGRTVPHCRPGRGGRRPAPVYQRPAGRRRRRQGRRARLHRGR